MGMDEVGTLRWDGAVAQARMDNLLSANYTDKQVACACCRPMTACRSASCRRCKGVGYGSGDLPMPIVTGQDAEVPSVKSIIAGEQYSTVFKDTRELAKVTVEHGRRGAAAASEPEINDTKTYNNGVKVVPSYLLEARRGGQDQLGRDPDRLRLLSADRPSSLDQAEPCACRAGSSSCPRSVAQARP